MSLSTFGVLAYVPCVVENGASVVVVWHESAVFMQQVLRAGVIFPIHRANAALGQHEYAFTLLFQSLDSRHTVIECVYSI